MQPGNRFQSPDAVLMLFGEYLRDVGKLCGIVRCRITAHTPPIDRLGSEFRIRIALDDGRKSAFGIGPIFPHHRDAGQAHFEVGAELVFGQIALQPHPLLAFGIEDQHGRRPDRMKAAKVLGIFLDMNLERDEVLVDE